MTFCLLVLLIDTQNELFSEKFSDMKSFLNFAHFKANATFHTPYLLS